MDDTFLGADAEEVEKLISPEMKEKQVNRVANKDVKRRDDIGRKSRRMKTTAWQNNEAALSGPQLEVRNFN